MSDLRPLDVSTLKAPERVSPGAAPMLQWIEIGHLVVDDSYQRSPHLKAVQSIADRFDWRKFSPVVVAPVEGGLFAIIDGQHRSHAAALCGIERVPCLVTIMDRAEQARAFAAINGQATPVNIFTMFKAAIAAGEPWAIELRDTCAEAGCQAMTYPISLDRRKPGFIQGIGFVRTMIARRGRDPIARTLRIVRETKGLGDEKDTWNLMILHPLVGAIASRPHVLADHAKAVRALEEIDVYELLENARKFRANRARSGLPAMQVRDLLESLVGDALDKAFRTNEGKA